MAIFYVVSESLANVAKHADASAVTVRVAQSGDAVVVEVADDGVGGADDTQGSGLRGLADRVEALDGRLVVESPAGRRARAWSRRCRSHGCGNPYRRTLASRISP